MIDQTLVELTFRLIDLTTSLVYWMAVHWYISIPILYVEYVTMMRVWLTSKGTWWEKYYKWSAGWIFLPQDVVVNLIACTVLFIDPPPVKQPWELMTWRMIRYKRTKGQGLWNPGILTRWREFAAYRICKLLNPYQQAINSRDHC